MLRNRKTTNTTMKPKRLLTLHVKALIRFNEEQVKKLNRAINEHYLGDPECNMLNENGVAVPKHPEKETPEFRNAVWRVYQTREVTLPVHFCEDGSLELEKP